MKYLSRIFGGSKTFIGRLISTSESQLEECYKLLNKDNIILVDVKGLRVDLDTLKALGLNFMLDLDFDMPRIIECLEIFRKNNIFVKEKFTHYKVAFPDKFLWINNIQFRCLYSNVEQ